MKIKILTGFLSIALLFNSCSQISSDNAQSNNITPENFAKSLQEQLITAKPGDVIVIPEGKFTFENTLSLDGIEDITLKGQGMDKTILSFAGQTEGAEGLRVKDADNFIIEDLAIEDSKGDGIKMQDCDGLIVRRIRVEWTNGPDSANGAYGIYPVSSKNILMEDCIARGASDAGIYLGQSENCILRRNLAEYNVAGIEVENTINAEVYSNKTTNNTAGLLVFDLPDLPKKNGKNIRVYDNEIISNNLPNFSRAGLSVSVLPAGLGLMFMACQHAEAFNNRIINNNSLGTVVVNLDQMGKQTSDSLYNKYPSAIYVHDNYYERAEVVADTTRPIGKFIYSMFGNNLPMILFDGFYNPELMA
ncbi:MAG TPA: parallel beta-helix domain-containing protein, partial [Flavobacterium sp.]|nr:parallel beta-helix domain-containing protein [Flavobacterium sp.]